VALPDFLAELVDRIADDAEHLRCRREIEHCKAIARLGSSADHQLRAAEQSAEPLEAVKRYIADATIGVTRADRGKIELHSMAAG
jgi:gamma-glutamyl:cysteine ligase YbdK (ATP-grasp superfamily)